MSWSESLRPLLPGAVLEAAFAADGVHYLGRSPWGGRPLDHGHIPCAGPAADWPARLEALSRLLAERRPLPRQLRVVLANGLVQYQLLPWRSGIAGGAEWQAYAGLRFREVYGENADDWSLRVSEAVPGRTRLACAMPRALLEGLRGLERHGVRLASVQPQFAAVFDRQRRRLGRNSFGLAVVEPDRVCLALLDGRDWQAIRCESSGAAWSQTLAGMLRRLRLSLDVAEEGTLHLCGAGEHSLPGRLDGLALHPLSPAGNWLPGQSRVALALGY